MHLIYSVLLALLIAATPQARNLSSLLSSHENLSSLNSVVSASPELVQALDSAKDVTVLAPSNAAIDRLRNETNSTTLESQFNDPAFARALLQYHVLNGEYAERNIGEIGMFIPTLLTDDAYVNITGGQVVQAIRTPNSAAGSNSDSLPGKTVFYSGYNKNSTVIEPVRISYLDSSAYLHILNVLQDIRFDGGLVHVVDSVLVIPANITATSIAAGLTSHVGAVEDASFKWDEWSNSTFFVPNNQGFQVVGSVLMDMTPEELHTILMYHVINDTTPIYTPEIDHADWITTTDTNVTFNFTADSTIFVNSAAIVQANILVANGVIHIIDK